MEPFHLEAKAAGWLRPVRLNLLLAATDYIAILILPLVACCFTNIPENLQRNALFWNLLAFITVVLIASHDGYSQESLTQLGANAKLATRDYVATSVAMLSVAILLGHEHAVSPFWTTAELVLTPIFLSSARGALALPAKQEEAARGPVIICYNHAPGGLLRRALAAQKIAGKPSGILYLADPVDSPPDIAVIPGLASLLAGICAGRVQDIIFLDQPELETTSAAAQQTLLAELLPYRARIWMAFDLKPQLPNLLANRSGRYRLVPLVTDDLITSSNVGKRLFDCVTSLALLVVLLPVLALIAALVRASGPGPVVFRQRRTGAHGRSFNVLKFRTMHHEAGAPFRQATASDRRVTKIGRFLRRSSLDELLQLVNVVKGEMSLVGPRPHAPETQVQGISFEDAVKLYRLRYRVRPGITGLAQIRGQRGATLHLETLEQRIASDLEYIERWSFSLDLLILLRTLPAFIKPKNAV